MSSLTDRGPSWLVGISLLVFLAGCGEKMVTTSAQDKSLVTWLPMAQKAEPTDRGFGKPGTLEEARMTEPPPPPLEAVPAPTETAPAPAVPAPGAVTKLAGLADAFFDFDRAAIRNDARAVLEADANLLKPENDWKLLISGHCDERGTLAYNLVLGERRAQAAKRYLMDLGLSGALIKIVSYGKERPFCAEHSLNCWQKNRRAHLQVQ